MTLIEDSFWTLRIDPTRPIPLTPEEPEDFMYEVCGKILCGTEEDEKDRVAGRFRLYYADFETALNHGVSAFEVLDAYQHTLELEPKQSRDSSAWTKRLRLEDLPRDAKMATEKLKQYYEKLGFVRMRSTPFMFRSMSWALPAVEQLSSE